MEEKKKISKKIYLQVFLSTLGISTVAFGGGFVVLPMLRKRYVEKYGWITHAEMDDYIALAQAAPGTIAGNTAMLIGFQVAGVLGAILAMIASIIPALVLITILAFLYDSFAQNQYVGYFMAGMQAGVAAVIISLVYDMAKPYVKNKNIFAVVLTIAGFCLAFLTSVNVIFVILGAAIIGIVYNYISIWYKKKKDVKLKALSENDNPIEKIEENIEKHEKETKISENIEENSATFEKSEVGKKDKNASNQAKELTSSENNLDCENDDYLEKSNLQNKEQEDKKEEETNENSSTEKEGEDI